MFDESSPLSEDVDSSLQPIIYFISSDGWVAVGGYPHACVLVGVDLVLDELSHALLVHVDAARLAVVNLAANHGWVGLSLHFKASNAVIMDVIRFKVALRSDLILC